MSQPPPSPDKTINPKITTRKSIETEEEISNIKLKPVETIVKTKMDFLSIEERQNINPFEEKQNHVKAKGSPLVPPSVDPNGNQTGLPPTPPSPSKINDQTEKKKKWSVDLGEQTLELKDLKNKKSCDLTKEINWNKMKGMAFSEAGSAGVFFCLLEDDTIVVVKGNSTIGEELFASKFAPMLDVLAPKMRLVEYLPKRFPKANLGSYDWTYIKRELPKHAGIKKSKVTKELDRGFFLLMEYVPNSVDLQKVNQELLESEGCLKDIGRIMIMDLVLNNWDRLSCGCIWKHEGNPANILFQKDLQRCAAIDQATTPIFKDIHKEGYENYISEVKECISLIKNSQYGEEDPIDSICKMIENYSTIKLSKESRKIILISMKESIEKLIKITIVDLNKLKTMVEEELTGSDWADVYSLQMKNIDVDFMWDVINTVKNEYEK
eukprot:gene12866-7289_t